MTRIVISVLACLMLPGVTSAQQHQFVFEGAEVLPEVSVNGKRAIIHTQGLHVTDDSYWVTGRLERKPKRALLLRISRDGRKACEFIDITPPAIDGAILDHPGGFDVDSDGGLWIPLSTSNAAGPSLIYRISVKPNQPLAAREQVAVFRVNDHIGAICLSKDDSLVGANWDTKRVYRWSRDGVELMSVEREKVFAQTPDWQLAVQDWKRVELGRGDSIIAGGLDKSGESSKATVQLIDVIQGKIYETHRFSPQANVSRAITNEGLDVHDRTLFLLPEDIGRGAKVLRYQIIPPK